MFNSCIVETLSDALLPFHEVRNTGQKMLWGEDLTRTFPRFYDTMYMQFTIKDKKKCDDSLYLRIHCSISLNQAVLVP